MNEHRDGSGHEHRMDQDGTWWKAAIGYGRHARRFWSDDVNRAVVELAAPESGEVALDIGAGMGAGAFPAATLVGDWGQVHAVEPTPLMRRALDLRRRTNRHRHRITVHDAVAESLPLADASVDVAWAVNVLHHISDLQGAIDELARVLRPGGRVVLVDEDFDDPAHPDHEEMQQRHGSHHGGDRHHSTDEGGHHHLMVDIEALADTAHNAGFVDVEAGPVLTAGVPSRRLVARRPPSYVPTGSNAVVPYLTVSDTRAAIEWWGRHFGATVTFEPFVDGDGRVGHAEVEIGGVQLMVADEFPEMNVLAPTARGGTTVAFVVWVDDVDGCVEGALADGAVLERPVAEQPHGARAAWIADPFGHRWNVATHHTDVPHEELRRLIGDG